MRMLVQDKNRKNHCFQAESQMVAAAAAQQSAALVAQAGLDGTLFASQLLQLQVP